MRPEEAASQLAEIAYLLRLQGDQYRARAFTRAALSLLQQRPDLERLHGLGRLEEIEGVGAGIARTLAELLDSGRSGYLERLRGAAAPDPAVRPSPQMSGYRGDLHCHTDWSDGQASVLEMALAARARGYEYLCITDHSPRIAVVRGLGPERLLAQRREIERVNGQLEGITVLQGSEVDILEDGSLDLPDEALAALDLVLASPHLKLSMDPARMTERMLRAVENSRVHVLAHPTGRRPGTRAGAVYDFEAVFGAAAALGVIMEMDCDPARMDLSPELAQLACSLGCRMALDSDAHAPDQLLYTELGLWSVRRAGVPEDRIVNWLPLDQLRTSLRRC